MKLKSNILLIVLLGVFTFVNAQDAPSAASLYNDGLAKLKAKEYTDALSLLEQAIESADTDADEKVLKLAKRNAAFAAYYVGNELRKGEQFDEAIETYNKGISYMASIYNNYTGLAQAYEGKGENVEAVKAYVKAADMTKKQGEASIEKGKEERGQKLIDRSEKLANKAANFSAKAYSSKDYEDAINTAKAFLDVRDHAGAYYYLAMSLKSTGKNSDAVEYINKAVELADDADKSKFYFGKGQIHEALGQKSEAIAAYKLVTDAKYSERAKYNADKLSGGR